MGKAKGRKDVSPGKKPGPLTKKERKERKRRRRKRYSGKSTKNVIQ